MDKMDEKFGLQQPAKDWRNSITHVMHQARRCQRLTLRITLALALILLLAFYGVGPPVGAGPSFEYTAAFPQQETPSEFLSHPAIKKQERQLHLLVPASKPDVNLCKTILSAEVLNYSTPTLINWGEEFNDNSLSSGGSHLAKISGVLRYLKAVGPDGDEDLVMIIDAYDIWLQLRPDILLSRYYAANARMSQRISRRMCGRDKCPYSPVSHISQKIIFSTQKLCWPHRAEDLACYAAAESSMPDDIFGPDTDQIPGGDEETRLRHIRSRHVNSGFAIGPVKEMRRLFEAAEAHAKEDPHSGSDQGVLADIIGLQEYARELMREMYFYRHPFRRFTNTVAGLVLGKSSFEKGRDQILHPDLDQEREIPRLPYENTTALRLLEYNVGLDYEDDFSHVTVFAPRDTDWVVFSQPEVPSMYYNIRSSHIGKLPNDIGNSRPPFEGFNLPSKANASIPLGPVGWEHVPLNTHLWTGQVPVSVHHNAWQRGMKNLRHHMWGLLWWNEYAREMFAAHVRGAKQPLAVQVHKSVRGGAHTITEWWSPIENRGGAAMENGTWIEWKHLCGKWDKELFMDQDKDKEHDMVHHS
ncbi:hypothetical protein EDD36DRAFT_494422 [Exophiala viscosa]|uniref:Uncharacterized protein n=1 Tax=Exophiala viscosa TaxID=2486360 RepID=A0AAN6DZM7_9EURO|nr:hypothetical protein EDD36DRAFT_494422 [Exophiala viscosa]